MNQIAKRPTLAPAEVRATIVKLVPEFTRALPPGVDPHRFARVVQTAIQQNDKLLECSPESLWGACMKAAQDGLMPDGREGAMVPRWNNKKGALEAHWMPMVAGLIAKAKRKGSVSSLAAQVVYEGEQFEVLLGDEDRIVHRRDITKVKRGAEIAVYAIATMKDGSKEREVMTWEQVQQIAAVSADKKTGEVSDVWKLWDSEMARKSVIRRLSKRLPSLNDGDDDFKRAVERVDELYEFGKPAVAAPPIHAAIEHKQTVPSPSFEAEHPETASAAPTLDETLNGDNWDFDAPAPKPDRQRKVADRFRERMAEVQDQDGYNAVMGNTGVLAEWNKIRAERPDLDEEMRAVAAEALARITDAQAELSS